MNDIEKSCLKNIRRNVEVAQIAHTEILTILRGLSLETTKVALEVLSDKTKEIPREGDVFDSAAFFYSCSTTNPTQADRDRMRANGFISTKEFTTHVNLSRNFIWQFTRTQPELHKKNFLEHTLFFNKNVLIERISKTRLWRKREASGILFFAPKMQA